MENRLLCAIISQWWKAISKNYRYNIRNNVFFMLPVLGTLGRILKILTLFHFTTFQSLDLNFTTF